MTTSKNCTMLPETDCWKPVRLRAFPAGLTSIVMALGLAAIALRISGEMDSIFATGGDDASYANLVVVPGETFTGTFNDHLTGWRRRISA